MEEYHKCGIRVSLNRMETGKGSLTRWHLYWGRGRQATWGVQGRSFSQLKGQEGQAKPLVLFQSLHLPDTRSHEHLLSNLPYCDTSSNPRFPSRWSQAWRILKFIRRVTIPGSTFCSWSTLQELHYFILSVYVDIVFEYPPSQKLDLCSKHAYKKKERQENGEKLMFPSSWSYPLSEA